MISAPAGGASVPTETIRSSATTMTAFATARPFGSITLPARMAFVAANAGPARSASIVPMQAALRRLNLFILRPGFLNLIGDVPCKRVRRDDPREGTEAED